MLEGVPVSPVTEEDTAVNIKGHLYALPKGYVRMTIERKLEEKKSVLTVTPAEPLLVADPDHIYRLRYKVDRKVSEEVKIEIGANGLLKN